MNDSTALHTSSSAGVLAASSRFTYLRARPSTHMTSVSAPISRTSAQGDRSRTSRRIAGVLVIAAGRAEPEPLSSGVEDPSRAAHGAIRVGALPVGWA
jgi:hypothetical protein